MLKNVLSLLLSKFYSKKESGEVAHQALPSTNGTYLFSNKSVSNWGTVSTGVAPYDGFLVLNANGDGTSDSASIFVSTPCVRSMITFPFPSAGCTTWAPIAKGEAWAVQGSNAKQISLELRKTIGGGYQTLKELILQGGAICLSNLCSSLRRSSLLATRNGSGVKLSSQTQIPEQRSLLTTLRLNFIRLQVMDGLHSAETDHRSMSALLESWERVALTLKVISELQLRFGRGTPLVSIARRTISNRLRPNSFPAKGQRNTLLVGGASC